MRVAVLSDIHANLEALDAVLGRARAEGFDAVYVLGDIVGYGADPDAVIRRLREEPSATLIGGNHDLAAVGRFDTTWFNRAAAEAIRWTAGVLGEPHRRFLKGLEASGRADDTLLVHGSAVDPVAEYVVNEARAVASFEADEFDVCLFGHTHLPTAFVRAPSGRVEGGVLPDGEALSLEPGARYMLNPGSVGQPRDGDPRASFMVFDSGARTAVVHRVEYAIEQAQRKIRAAGLPEPLADRLAVGR